jgi:hypothetical protein
MESKNDIMCAPNPIIKKNLIPDKDVKGKMKFQRQGQDEVPHLYDKGTPLLFSLHFL